MFFILFQLPNSTSFVIQNLQNVTADKCQLNITYVTNTSTEISQVKCPGMWEYDRGPVGPVGLAEWTIASEV